MRIRLVKPFLSACAMAAILPIASPAQQLPNAQLPAANSSPDGTWRIGCHIAAGIPMTSDAAQALPLQIVATLKCGDEVTLLSNSEGYTAHVRTADGADGYVAAMYLKKAPASRRAIDPATLKNGVVRWKDGAPGCDHFAGSDGGSVESLMMNGVTVQVSLRDTGWKFRANIAIANGSAQPIDIDPPRFILDNVGAHGKPLFYQDPTELAKNVTHQALWTEADAMPANIQTRADSFDATSAAVPLSYKIPVSSNPPAPNYLVQHQAAEDDAIRKQTKQTFANTAQQIHSLALKPSTIQPNQTVSGAVWFDRDKNPQQLMLRIPVGDITFEFPLSFKQLK